MAALIIEFCSYNGEDDDEQNISNHTRLFIQVKEMQLKDKGSGLVV